MTPAALLPRSARRKLFGLLAAVALGLAASVLVGGPRSASADTMPGTTDTTPACPTYNPPNALTLTGGTPQTARLGTAFADPFQVQLTNSNGCPITTPLAGRVVAEMHEECARAARPGVTTGELDNVVAIRKGSETEIQSGIGRQQANIIESHPAVASSPDGQRMVSKEAVVLISLKKVGAAKPSNVIIRGASPLGLDLRPQIEARPAGAWLQRVLPEPALGER